MLAVCALLSAWIQKRYRTRYQQSTLTGRHIPMHSIQPQTHSSCSQPERCVFLDPIQRALPFKAPFFSCFCCFAEPDLLSDTSLRFRTAKKFDSYFKYRTILKYGYLTVDQSQTSMNQLLRVVSKGKLPCRIQRDLKLLASKLACLRLGSWI